MVIDESLSDHIVEDGGDTVLRDGSPGHTQDSVETSGSEVKGQVGHFSKGSSLDRKSTEGDSILGKETFDSSRSVLDFKFSSVGFKSTRCIFMVPVLQEANNFSALSRRNPEVGRTSIEDDLKFLGRSTNLDRSIVLSVLNILNGNVGKNTKLSSASGLADGD